MTKLNAQMEDAVQQLMRHPSVSNVTVQEKPGGGVVVTADFDTNLPSTWRAQGASPTGVRPVETVEFEFPSDYPLRAPVPTLRPDFNRTLPHINPHRKGDRVPPCTIFGGTLEVLHSEGVYRLYDQVAVWLENAAENKLIDNGPGWEPMRRDSCADFLEVDDDEVAKVLTPGNAKLYRIHITWPDDSAVSFGWGKRTGPSTLTPSELAKATAVVRVQEWNVVGSFFVVCCPEANGAEGPKVVDQYQPDSVTNYSDLKLLADQVGCGQALARFAANLDAVSRSVSSKQSVPIYLALAVRRPTHLIGLKSDYELLTYRVDIRPQQGAVLTDDAPARPVLLTTPLSPALLRQASGIETEQVRIELGLVGCGSLGSKVATHVARAGYAPKVLVDNDGFLPHNAARHALFPSQFRRVGNKAKQLAGELGEFFEGRKPTVFDRSIRLLPFEDKKFNAFFSNENAALLNTTGSHSVRYFLNDAPFRARVMEACLLNLGSAAVMTLEGAGRNPSTTDLMAHTFERLRENGLLQRPVTGHEGTVGVGVGCNSVTLPMTDGNISLVAAGVGQTALRLFEDGLPELGCASIAKIGSDKMSVEWLHDAVGRTHIAGVADSNAWSVRVLDAAHRKMCADVAAHPRVETGGVVVGRVSATLREITIVDVLDAPPDSKRAPNAFTLGVAGLSERIDAYDKSGQGVLWCLGTWHSHLQAFGPSSTDVATANKLKGSIAGAVVLLIHRPDGYSALVRDEF
ncbi:MAG: Mov34/MPN/PAD-1 family protein [Rhodocyclaceae bacterium]|nr:Mov34/MPN/PAD-1 family protein [Rhodocyclaceae bacterium]